MDRRLVLSVRVWLGSLAGASLALLLLLWSACSNDSVGDAETMSPESTANEAEPTPIDGVDFHHYDVNGLRMRVAEQGDGPLVLFVHGWPESWYSWRHQIPAVAAAGYHAVAPDMRGYGGTTAPSAVDDYDITHLCADLAGLVAELGEEKAVLVGHDWGAVAGWQCALLEPDVFRAAVNMSVPYRGRSERSLIEVLQQAYGENFFYILYFQELDEDGSGIAEAEFDADPRGILSRLYTSPGTPREDPEVTDPLRSAGGWIPRLGAPTALPAWLSEDDLDYYVGEFARAGFRGGISYYRNFHRNWETTPQLDGAQVQQPSLFIAGDKDAVIAGATQEQLEDSMGPVIADLRGVHVIADTGHWVQQERPEEVNGLLLEFLASLE